MKLAPAAHRAGAGAALALALAACVPDPRGSCARDADCGGATGLFCAEGICQARPRAALEEVPRTVFGRAQTATLRVRIDRAHGGAEAASASLSINGSTMDGVREADGRLRFDVPLRLAPAGIEAQVPLQVSVLDDLGHATVLSDSLSLDDLAPRIFIDADSVPAQPVLRGAVVHLRAHVFDGSAVTLLPSPGSTLTRQLDGSYLVEIDSRALDPSLTIAQFVLAAADGAGNRSSSSAEFPLTRVRWQSTPNAFPGIGIALTAAHVVVTKGTHQVVIDRPRGSLARTVVLGAAALGNLATDGTRFFTARVDGKVSSFGLDGTVRWTCDGFGTLNSGPALGPFSVSARTFLAAIVPGLANATVDQRLYAIRDDLATSAVALPQGVCTATNGAVQSAALTSFNFDLGAASIAADGTVYVAASKALVHAAFDGASWGTPTLVAGNSRFTGQPALQRPAGGTQVAVLSGTDGVVQALAFPAGSSGEFSTQAPRQIGVAATPPTIGEGGIVTVGTDDNQVVALSPSGSLLWRTTISGAATTPPTHGTGGVLYVGARTGVTALRLQDGAIAWTFSTAAPVRTPPALGCDGVLYLADDSGAVTALQTDSPALADSPWPRAGRDVHGSGDARRALRAPDGSCTE